MSYVDDQAQNRGLAVGSVSRTMASLAKSLNRRFPFGLDTDIAEGHKNSEGTFRSYTGYLPDGRELRINFLLVDPDRIHSVDLFEEDATAPQKSLVFEEDAELSQISEIVIDLVTSNLKDPDSYISHPRIVRGRAPIGSAQRKVLDWLNDPDHTKTRIKAIQHEKLARVYVDYVRSQPEGEKPLSQGSFIKYVKHYLASNGLKNRWAKGPYITKKVTQEIDIELPEEEKVVKRFGSVNDAGSVNQMLFSWSDIFDDIKHDFEELMENPDQYPYGMVLYGNGGTGKSYFFEEEAPKYASVIIKGAPNTSTLFNILYENKDKQLIIFDDADSVIVNPNSVNILKAALTDTGERKVFAPNKTAMKDKDLISLGENQKYFVFNACVVVITNVKQGIRDKALESRVYAIALFMTKGDIIEKIRATCDPGVFGVTEEQADTVAEFLTDLVEDGRFEVRDEFVSYRFYKQGVKYIKRHPDKWRGKMLRKLRIGIRTSI